ncbi:sce7726 family protein [Lysinibacillus louembei]|uniref:Sce7726 family protein n=1 Tax=Lysinibacillus louembei TaxID=1470088 RepID=A0ABZ0RPY7_9BACI|nr:sce7726 family protein [Lysinibacillus louembei]WPK10284.1 sce7726 family protein [Lysinibacillus louembei]
MFFKIESLESATDDIEKTRIKVRIMQQSNLANIYSKKYIENILKKYDYYQDLRAVDENIEELFESYKIMKKSYRNEYFYKNTLFNKHVLGKYNLNTTFVMNEVTISKSKADMIIVNKNLPIVYEIKTELDNFDKLEHQIIDYYKVASLVYVITAENTYYPLYRMLKDTRVGIYVLTKRNTLSLKKKAEEEAEFLNHKILFKLLRKSEYEKIVMGYFGYLPNVNAFEYYTECLKLFTEIEILEAQKMVFNEIWRREEEIVKGTIQSIPYELRWLVYSCKFNKKIYEKILEIFN